MCLVCSICSFKLTEKRRHCAFLLRLWESYQYTNKYGLRNKISFWAAVPDIHVGMMYTTSRALNTNVAPDLVIDYISTYVHVSFNIPNVNGALYYFWPSRDQVLFCLTFSDCCCCGQWAILFFLPASLQFVQTISSCYYVKQPSMLGTVNIARHNP